MSNTKIQLIVIAAVMLLAGSGLWLLMNPDIFGNADDGFKRSDPSKTETPDGDDEVFSAYKDGSESEDLIDGEEKQRKTETVLSNGNPHVEELNARINALGEAEWSKRAYIRLRSDIDGKRDAGLITPEIAKSLSGNLFNVYLITVKEAALKVIKTSSRLSDLWPPHKELKRLKLMVTDSRVTEVTDMTHAIYTIPYHTGKLEEAIGEGGLTDEDLMGEANKVGKRIEGLPGRFALFNRSPLVKAVCKKGRKDLGEHWGQEIIVRNNGKVKNYTSLKKFDDVETSSYRDDLINFSGSKYLSLNANFVTWVKEQTDMLAAHEAAEEEFNLYASMGGTDDCSMFEQFKYYLENCKSKVDTLDSNN